jgi:surface antigen
MGLTERSAQNLKIFMDSKGFRASQVTFEVDTTSRRKRARVTYRTRQGEPYRIDSVSYEFRDKFLEQIILPDTANTLLRKGGIFDITVLDRERERIAAYLKERGYYNFTVNNIEYVADTLGGGHKVGLELVVKQNLTGYDERGLPVMDNNMVYRIDQINVFPNYDPTVARTDSTFLQRLDTLYYRGLNIVYEKRPNLRPAILRQAVPLYPNYVYNSAQVNRAYTDLMSLGYFKSAKIEFEEQPQSADVTNYVSFIGASADSTQTRYTREGYLKCNILCTPTLKQSFKVDLEGSTTSSFYGLKATVGYQNRNIFRGAEAFDVSFTAGYEFMKAPDARKKRATEFGITTGLTFPRFLMPWRTRRFRSVNQPKTKVELSVNFQDRPYYRRTLSSAGITYQWTNDRYSSFSLRPIDINVVDVNNLDESFLMINKTDSAGHQELTPNKYLLESFRTQFIGGLTFGYSYNNQRKNLGGNATNIRFNFETAGNLIDAVDRLFYARPKDGSPAKIFGIEYSQYFRTDLSISRKIMLGGATALVGRIYGGVAMAYGNSASVPFDRQFYCGGSNGMRGWAPRTLGQGSVPDPHSSFPIQTGDVKLEANLELRFPVWGMVHGATFFDLGNIWYIRQSSDYSDDAVFHFDKFYKQLGFNTGIGLRLDIKFAVLRLDWGVQLHNPNNPSGEKWIHNLRWKNTALNFGVGYPF